MLFEGENGKGKIGLDVRGFLLAILVGVYLLSFFFSSPRSKYYKN